MTMMRFNNVGLQWTESGDEGCGRGAVRLERSSFSCLRITSLLS